MDAGPTRALVRRVARSYVAYYARRNRVVSAALADEQHQQYVGALEASGLSVSMIEADESLSDGVFIEDTAVLCRGHALITRMCHQREGEQAAVEAFLRPSHSISRLPPGAMLEGGDVMHIGDTSYVGISARTNELGAESLKSFLAQFGRRVVSVPTPNCLHLKTGVTYLGNGTLLAVPAWFDIHRFDVDDVIYTAAGEDGSANCLRIHDHLLVQGGFPQTARRLQQFAEKHGVRMTPLAISEFQKGDGSLTCLSLIW
jgi:dimethylargininase